MRCAIYARYSSDLQRETSIEDQIRNCRVYAERQGWTVLNDYVRSDKAISGASLTERPALNGLLAAAQQKPRPFDRLLIDDTSRLARNLVDALKTVDIFKFHGIYVTFIANGIDTADKSSRQMLTVNGMFDEQALVGLAQKVHRGQEGRVRKGFNPGGRLFGYQNVPIENANRPGKYGRPAVDAVKQVIIPEQAEVVRRIFTMSSNGIGLSGIAKTLNAEGVPSPQPSRNRSIRAWCPSSIQEMLHNKLYIRRAGVEPNRKDTQPYHWPEGQ
jgi:DNA invertase Pin-like site-specific DNA recombinase